MTSSRKDHKHPIGVEPHIIQLREALRGLEHGSLNLIVQDGIVIQIDRLEKIRLHQPPYKSKAFKPLVVQVYWKRKIITHSKSGGYSFVLMWMLTGRSEANTL